MFHLGERVGTLQITEWTVDYGVGLVWASAAHLSDRVWAAAGARVKVNGDHLHCVKCGLREPAYKNPRLVSWSASKNGLGWLGLTLARANKNIQASLS